MFERPRRYALPLAIALLVMGHPLAAEWTLDRIELISRVPFAAGEASYGHSGATSRAFSADGRYLVWASTSSALLAGVSDHNGGGDIFLTDLEDGTTTLISHRPGSTSNASAAIHHSPQISADGRFVVYSSATHLMTTSLFWNFQIYLYDRSSGTRQLITHAFGSAAEANGFSFLLDISADGRYVALWSSATDLMAGLVDEPETHDIFLWDRVTDTFQLVSHRPGAPLTAAGNTGGSPGELSADGRFLAFSTFSDLAGKGPVDFPQIYLFDHETGINTLVSRTPEGEPAGGESMRDLTPDGRFVLFTSTSGASMVPGSGDRGATPEHLYLFDRRNASVELISRRVGSGQAIGNGRSPVGALSDDGRFVYFSSLATNLVAGTVDDPETYDLFLRDRGAQSTTLISRSAADPNLAAHIASYYEFAVTGDGASATFESDSTSLMAGTVGGEGPFVYRYDRSSAQNTLLSHAPSSTTQAVDAQVVAMSPDGGRFFWSTRSTTVLTGIADPQLDGVDPVIHDRIRGASIPLNRAASAGFEASVGRFTFKVPRLSDDGRRVAFLTNGRLCAPTQPVAFLEERACLLDRTSGEMRLLSHRWDDPALAIPAATTRLLEFSQDGRWLLLDSSELGMAPSDSAETCDLFLYDTEQRTFELVSHVAGSSTVAAGGSCQTTTEYVVAPASHNDRPQLSGDALRVLFTSDASSLDGGTTDGNGEADVFLRDRSSGQNHLLTTAAGSPGQAANGASSALEISADGRFALVHSMATNLLAGFVDGNGAQGDLFLVDLQLGTRALVSRSTGSPVQSGNAGTNKLAAMSTDGRFVAFTSSAGDHVTGKDDDGGELDVFLFDRGTGDITLVSHGLGQPPVVSEGASYLQDLSSDGRFVLFLRETKEPGEWPYAPIRHLHLWDRLDGSIQLVSHRNGQPAVPIGAEWGRVSADGRRVALITLDNEATAIENDFPYHDLFVWDGADASLSLISRRYEDPPRDGMGISPYGALPPQWNSSGGLLLFASSASDLLGSAHDGNQEPDFFLAHLRDGFFSDGFESGDVSAWSSSRP